MNYKKFPRDYRSLFLLLAVFVTALFCLDLSSAVSSQNKTRSRAKMDTDSFRPVSSRAIAFAESRPARELYLTSTDTETSIERVQKLKLNKYVEPKDLEEHQAKDTIQGQQTDVEREINKTNRQNGRTVNEGLKSERDGALSTASPVTNESPQPLPTPSVTFDGVSFLDTRALGQGFLPPDTVGEAGPNHFVQAVNVVFRVWDKSGNPLIQPTSLGSLFSALPPGGCRSSIDGDPIVLYDQLADRWVISQMCLETFPRQELIAVSKTGDPTGSYFLYEFVLPNSKVIDYPKLGVWPDGYYMSENQYDRTGLFFSGAGFFSFDRTKMLAGDPTASYVYFDSCPKNVNCKLFGGLPSDLEGMTPPPLGAPNTFAFFTADDFNDPEGDGLRLFDFHADFANPGNSTLTERPGSPLPTAAFDSRIQPVKEPNVATFSYLDPIGDVLMNRLSYRNFGNGRESLVVSHNVEIMDDHVGLRYYELNKMSGNGPYTIAEQQTFSPDSDGRWMGSGAMNSNGDTVFGFSKSSTTVFPSLFYASKFVGDPAGSGLFQGEQTLFSGTGSQTSSSHRWGDYSDISVDPVDDCGFWYTTEYYTSTRYGSDQWQTRVAKVTPRPCAAPQRGTIRGTVTSCSTGLPLQGVTVETPDGYQRSTDAGGTYSMTVLPGTYSLTAHKFGYSTSSEDGVNVSNGGSATKDFCVLPVAVFDKPKVTVTTGNSILEPNECNLLKIPLTNNGAATITNVTAELSTTTPGVTITSAASAYPDLNAAGGTGTNVSPFQIVIDETVACFSNISLKLTLNYSGGEAPSVIDFTAQVGQAIGPNYAFTPSYGATVPTNGVLIHPGSITNLNEEVPAPFAFSLYGRPIAAGQKITIDEPGVVEINPLMFANPNSINAPLPTGTFESPVAVVLPFWDDIIMRPDVVTGAGIFTALTGEAPTRTYMIEWRGRTDQINDFGPLNTDVAVFFHENSDNFEIVYGQTGSGLSANGATASIGVQGKNFGTNYTAWSWHAPWVPPGTKLSASRPPAICFRGSGVCGGTSRTAFDFDGDSKADISVFRPNGVNGAEWWYQNSSDGQVPAAQFGTSSDIPAPADYTGDGKTDIAFFRPSTGEWFILRSEDYSYFALPYGQSGDIPVPADFDGDHRADVAVYRPSSHYWYVRQSSTGVSAILEFGLRNDNPVPADYDGDGKADVAVFRPNGTTGGEWWGIKSSTGGAFALSFGTAGDKAVPADYTGDGKVDFALWRPSTGQWFISRSEDFSYLAFPWGANGDVPVPADYDGDGKADTAVFRPSSATWYIYRTGGSGPLITSFGAATDSPVAGAFVR